MSDYMAIQNVGGVQYVWVSDEYNCQLHKYTVSGATALGAATNITLDSSICSAGIHQGNTGIAFDPSGNLYVASETTNNIYNMNYSTGAVISTHSTGYSSPNGLFIGR